MAQMEEVEWFSHPPAPAPKADPTNCLLWRMALLRHGDRNLGMEFWTFRPTSCGVSCQVAEQLVTVCYCGSIH